MAPCFTEVSEHNNTGFDYKIVGDKDGKKDGKGAVTNSEEEASKKRAQPKAKRDALWAQALLLIAMPVLSASTSASVPVTELSATLPELFVLAFASILIPGLSSAMV